MSKAQAFPTMVTPFNRDGSVDYGAARAMVDWYHEKGCGGIFATCQSSEIFNLTVAERVKLTKTVVDRAAELSSLHPDKPRLTVVASGHISDSFEDQVYELQSINAVGIDTLILISNRMDIANTGDEAWIADTTRLMDALPDMPLGVYECPSPYKRLMSDKMLTFCADSGRFYYMKDTCCDAALMAHRVKLIEGTPMKLYNANAQTLLETVRSGASGYCGVMCNFHPDLYVWLCENFEKEPEKADVLQSALSMAAFTEALAYPVTAKYHLKEIIGLPLSDIFTRKRPAADLTEYNVLCIRQMELLAEEMRKLIR
ncbi:MAG: dihydrodipicolinate synthase family protein [Ruminococcaceae bacterium]|nr:dihydrodipicolinate synthase family protein [Oscillospiraceae bacterium]